VAAVAAVAAAAAGGDVRHGPCELTNC